MNRIGPAVKPLEYHQTSTATGRKGIVPAKVSGCRSSSWIEKAGISFFIIAMLVPALAAAGREREATFVRTGLQAQSGSKPNIVCILADDLGWSDAGWHGSEIRTPALDRLAASGAKLEQFYVQPVCSPTRAALLTGRYPMRYGLQVGVVRPWAQYGLPLEERTLPQALQEAGYFTAITGKWHLGHFQPAYLPTRRGFDHQYGHYNGALDYFTHIRDGGFDWHRNDQICRDEGYTTSLIGREAVRLIEGHDRSRPLFLYVAFNAPHAPLQALQEHLELYSWIADKNRRPYAAMVTALDQQVAQIVAALDRRGMTAETLIFFSSDNGGPTQLGATNGKFRAGKGTLYEGGVRVPAFASWPSRIKSGTVVREPLHIVDWYPTLLRLAGASLTQGRPVDGKDIWLTITAGRRSPHQEILLNAAPATGAIRVGNWKLVLNGRVSAAEGENAPQSGANENPAERPIAGGASETELFNLADDPWEKVDLAAKESGKLQELRKRYEALARQAVPPKARPRPADFRSPKVWGEKENLP